MSCVTLGLSNIDRGCNDSVGSVKKVYVINFDKVASFAFSYADSGNTIPETITGMTLESGATFYSWNFAPNTAHAESTATLAPENQQFTLQNDLSIVFNKQDSQKRIQFLAACYNDLIVAYRDGSNKLWMMGWDGDPVMASAATAETGTNKSDRNAYNITLTEYSRFSPIEVVMSNDDLEALGLN